MAYRAPVAEIRHLLDHVVGYGAVTATDRFADAGGETGAAVLHGAGRLCEEVLAPLQRAGDRHPARLDNGVVRTAPGFAEGWRQIAEGGWLGLAAGPAHGGMGLPQTLATAVNEMMSSACLALQVAPLLSQGQIEALEHHASPALQRLFLPRLIAGDWNGTMNLTESQAGSDVGALRTLAEPRPDGSHSITGQKIYITWGDSDCAANVSHLVLARLPDAPPGTRGISLFLVPKYLPDPAGRPGAPNSLRVIGLEHKLGLHGAPTAVMSYEAATGWMVGAPNKGMAAMFTMMNNARLGVGVQGIGVAEAATQHALAHAVDRVQGRTPVAGEPGIIGHADVRRMLAVMRAETSAARAIALANAVAIDMARATGDPGWHARAALLTPITKAHGTDTGIAVADMGLQVHGGMGYVEETGAAQFLRDVRVTAIYEGTNGIQALDLVGRKMLDDGAAAFGLIDEVEAAATAAAGMLGQGTAGAVAQAAAALREGTVWLLAQDGQTRAAGATAYLRAFARVLGAHYLLRSALASGGAGPRLALARVHVGRLLPEHASALAAMRAGCDDLYALSAEDLAA